MVSGDDPLLKGELWRRFFLKSLCLMLTWWFIPRIPSRLVHPITPVISGWTLQKSHWKNQGYNLLRISGMSHQAPSPLMVGIHMVRHNSLVDSPYHSPPPTSFRRLLPRRPRFATQPLKTSVTPRIDEGNRKWEWFRNTGNVWGNSKNWIWVFQWACPGKFFPSFQFCEKCQAESSSSVN